TSHLTPRPPVSTRFPYTTLFRSSEGLTLNVPHAEKRQVADLIGSKDRNDVGMGELCRGACLTEKPLPNLRTVQRRREHLYRHQRSEEHTSELQSRENLVCRLLLE